MNIIKIYHKELLKYKNKHKGETCYIFGSGPTFNSFKLQEPGIFIGCNHIIKHEYIKKNLKYYFFGHGYTIYTSEDSIYGNHKKEVDNLGNEVEKFCMVSRDNDFSFHNFTEESIKNLKDINAIPCDMNLTHINIELDKEAFLNHSIVFPAIQFALYAGFSKIYLVGCDCNCMGYNTYFFRNIEQKNLDYSLISFWKQMYNFKKETFPNTKIININPIGLKGLMDGDINI
tara:strand:- start:723 stop:1412 length:690 start_codon:yes stop_codon:yes gene_type:complete